MNKLESHWRNSAKYFRIAAILCTEATDQQERTWGVQVISFMADLLWIDTNQQTTNYDDSHYTTVIFWCDIKREPWPRSSQSGLVSSINHSMENFCLCCLQSALLHCITHHPLWGRLYMHLTYRDYPKAHYKLTFRFSIYWFILYVISGLILRSIARSDRAMYGSY